MEMLSLVTMTSKRRKGLFGGRGKALTETGVEVNQTMSAMKIVLKLLCIKEVAGTIPFVMHAT